MRRTHWPRLLAAALVACGVAACGGAGADEAGVLPSLCRAMAAADGGTAGEIFESETHQPLHELADEVALTDRGVATRLLEAKFGVENVVRGDAEAPDALVVQRLEVLADEVRAALQALDRPAPSC